jgi:hypothetical protein
MAGQGPFNRTFVQNFPATQPVSGSISVANFPATQPISGSVSVTGALPAGANAIGSVSVSNFPASQAVSGTVAVSNFPSTQPVSGSVSLAGSLPSGTNALGSVSVSNFPASQAVTGSVSVSNLPTTQAVSGTVTVSGITGTVTTIARGTGSMATGQVAITGGATAVQIVPVRTARRSVTIVPTSQFTYFYGNAGVTQTTGAAAPNGAAITLETTAAVFVVSGSGGTMTFVEHF